MVDWLIDQFGWMRWNWPSAFFFIALFGAIAGFTVWDFVSPGVRRKGLFPIETTRGDRLFIGVVMTVGLFLLWLAIAGNQALWGAAVLAMIANAALGACGLSINPTG